VTPYLIIFTTAFIQIFFVSLQTIQIARVDTMEYAATRIFVVSICIALAWLYNINKGVKDCRLTKFIYIMGTSTGAVCGAKVNAIIGAII
jgi:hypothetical protein